MRQTVYVLKIYVLKIYVLKVHILKICVLHVNSFIVSYGFLSFLTPSLARASYFCGTIILITCKQTL